MLSKIRKNLRAFSLPLWIVAASFVGTIFLVWGKGSVSGPSANEVATVNGEGIKLSDFMREYNNTVNQLKAQLGENYRKIVSDEQLKALALQRLITRELLLQEAKREGLKVSDWAVAKAIEEILAFQENGKFSLKLYKEFLRARHLTPEVFENTVREDLLIQKLLTVVNNAPSVTKLEVEKFYREFFGSRKFKYKLFPFSQFKPEVSEKEVEEYYRSHKEEFAEKGETGQFLLKFPKTAEGEKEAKRAFELAREGKFEELLKMNPVKLTDKELQKELEKKQFVFRSTGNQLLLAFRVETKKYKPLQEVKKQIEERLAAEKAVKEAQKAAESYRGELPEETKALDRAEFAEKFRPVESPEKLFTVKVGERVVLRLSNGYGVFSPETELTVQKVDRNKVEKLKEFLIQQKRQTDYADFINLLRQKATIKVNTELLRNLR